MMEQDQQTKILTHMKTFYPYLRPIIQELFHKTNVHPSYRFTKIFGEFITIYTAYIFYSSLLWNKFSPPQNLSELFSTFQIETDKYNKPFFPHLNFYFNKSHSHNLFVIAFDKHNLGIVVKNEKGVIDHLDALRQIETNNFNSLDLHSICINNFIWDLQADDFLRLIKNDA